jgi:UDP-N-acetylglucosamine acyltransferase
MDSNTLLRNQIDAVYSKNFKVGNFNTVKGNVTIGNNVIIGNNCTIDGNITIGDNCNIGNNVTIINNVTLGNNNQIYSGCKIGYPAQHLTEHSIADKSIEIGNNNIFRENCTIHLPYILDKTTIKDFCFIMVNTNIPHDAIIHNNVIIAYNVAIGGHCEVFEYANLGLNSTIHQNIKIGAYAMIGMNTEIKKDVLPFVTIHNKTSKLIKINKIGFERKYKGNIALKEIENYIELISKNKSLPETLNSNLDYLLKPFKENNRIFYT